jgi:hypothetical protein
MHSKEFCLKIKYHLAAWLLFSVVCIHTSAAVSDMIVDCDYILSKADVIPYSDGGLVAGRLLKVEKTVLFNVQTHQFVDDNNTFVNDGYGISLEKITVNKWLLGSGANTINILHYISCNRCNKSALERKAFSIENGGEYGGLYFVVKNVASRHDRELVAVLGMPDFIVSQCGVLPLADVNIERIKTSLGVDLEDFRSQIINELNNKYK